MKSIKATLTLTAITIPICLVIVAAMLFGCTKTDVNGFMVDSKGCLLSYSGNETEITLPDNVTSISADAFKENTNADKIEKININASLESIEKGSFSNLSSLKSFTVAEDNMNYYTVKDCLVDKAEQALYFGLGSTYENSSFAFAMEELQKDPENDGRFTKMFIGSAEFDISFDYDEATQQCYSFMTSATAYGHKVDFENDEQLYGNLSVKFFQTNDSFVISRQNTAENKIWILKSEGVYEFSSHIYDFFNKEHDYTDSAYNFYLRDDGKIGYTRLSNKFTFTQTLYHQLYYCVDKDEFCKEDGYVEFDENGIVFKEETTYTVSAVYDLEEMFENWKKILNGTDQNCFEFYGKPEFETLDELLEYNKGLYKRAE